MDKLQEKLNELYRQQKQAQRMAAYDLKSGDINSAIRAQAQALDLETKLAQTRLELFRQNVKPHVEDTPAVAYAVAAA